MQKIVTNLWFDREAEEAARYYTSIFKDSKMGAITRFMGTAGFDIHGMAPGTVFTVEFEINGQNFLGLNGGPYFKFNEAVSFIINCDTQAELDYYWDHLTAGGDPNAQQCGWLKDKYGLSWQVVPASMTALMADPDTAKVDRVMEATLQMKKIDIAALERAAAQP